MHSVNIEGREIGTGRPALVIGEIGINHNGDISIAKKLIDVCVAAGCDVAKFQKRTVEAVYSPEELAKPRESPFGKTNGDLKRALEFSLDQYAEIFAYCEERNIICAASCWDERAVDDMDGFDPSFYKIASASLTDSALLRHMRAKGKPIILSTGMSTIEEIDAAVSVLGRDDLILLHTVSTYPMENSDANLAVIPMLAKRYCVPVGYSGHERGLAISLAAAAMGACVIERHVTLDRAMWGSDQAASLEPQGIERLVRDIRDVECARGDGVKRVLEKEIPIKAKLRRK